MESGPGGLPSGDCPGFGPGGRLSMNNADRTRRSVRKLVVAGTGSGAGKTTVTLGLMAALRSRGLRVQGFKCGPDYIDPSYHTAVTGRPSRNLDSWMLPRDAVKEIFARAAGDADISVIEGVMGFYDGKDPAANEGSTADIGMLLDSPVLLVVDCRSVARSAAAIVKGFQLLEPRANIAAVFANRVGSEGHYRMVREAIEQECGIPVVGWLKREDGIRVPERHLGLVPSIERGDLNGFFAELARLIAQTTDLDRLLALSESAPVRPAASLFAPKAPRRSATIAVARDAAFNFYYPENLELLEAYGARLVFFSPLGGEPLPQQADGVYIGGGFPEEFAGRLSEAKAFMASMRSAAMSGMPVLAECGGFMALTEAIVDRESRRFPMAGLIPGHVVMQPRLAALGYREIAGAAGNYLLPPGCRARGHEFHYSKYVPGERALPYAYETTGRGGVQPEGCLLHNVVAGYTHLHFGSCPELVERWLDRCLAFR